MLGSLKKNGRKDFEAQKQGKSSGLVVFMFIRVLIQRTCLVVMIIVKENDV